MRVLLLGEFSGVHNNLKLGLEFYDHHVFLCANGDGFKNLNYDFKLEKYDKSKSFYRIRNVINLYRNINLFIKYDLVQFISPNVFPVYLKFSGFSLIIKLFNKKMSYYICGTDPTYLKSKNNFDYFPFDENSSEIPKYRFYHIIFHNIFIRNMDFLIPSMYSYYIGYKDHAKINKMIPLPSFNSSAYSVKTKTKTKILFGITREEFKGAKFILQALKRIEKVYKDSISIEIVKQIEFKDYVRKIEESDILIDQCKFYEYGMNAIYALELGKIVLSGNNTDIHPYNNFFNCPIIHIKPNADFIFKKIDKILKKDSIGLEKLKLKGPNYVKNIHDYKEVSKLFLNVWRQKK
jgi:hypothetical protein